ncbi:MAG TPA: AraC family transcriptional regulator, partial [Clostridiales bacterium]|nr:AraC family transcriptional regulator [Clostridiales bacterium]
KYDTAKTEIPQFWADHYQTGKGSIICGMYGVCLDESMGADEFEYLIADNYDPSKVVPDGFVTKTIP